MITIKSKLKEAHTLNNATNSNTINRNDLFTQDLKKQIECNHDWNEVRVWSFGSTYIKYCNKCNAKETYSKPGKQK